MGSILDLIKANGPDDPNKGGQGDDAIWNGKQWVPRQIAAEGTERTGDLRYNPGPTINRTPNAYGDLDAGGSTSSMYASPEAFARANYGYLAGFLNHPQVGHIIRQAAAEGWDEARLYGAVSATSWWKNTSAAQRTWQQLTNEDPAEARRLVLQTAANMKNRARTLGLNVDVSGLAHTATANGWTDAQTVDALLQQVNWATLEAGDLTALRDNVKAIGSDYLVGVSDATAQNYAARIASGEMSEQGVRSAMLKQAKARFSYIASELDQGITVKDYFAPIKDTIARELGVAHEEVDLMDSRYLSMIEQRDDKGNIRAATMDEAMRKARQDPRFANTEKAKEMTSAMISKITTMFGR